LNDKALTIIKKIDSLELQCKGTELKDKETLAHLQHELQAVSGQLAANVAAVSAAATAADQDKAQVVKLNAQLTHLASMCKTQETALNTSLQMMLKDEDTAKNLRSISSQCTTALLATHAHTSTINASSPEASLLQGCDKEVAAPMIAAGKALENEGTGLTTAFAQKAFKKALQHASAHSALLEASKGWPSKAKPRSKAKAKAANSCKLGKGSVDCGVLKGHLDGLATRLMEQKNTAVTNQRKQMDDCLNKEKKVNVRVTSANSQNARSSSELVRLTGVKAGLAASRASIVTRLERTKRDVKKFQSTCEDGVSEYKGELEDILRERQRIANDLAGKKVAIQDCKVSDWVFSKCSKKCKTTDAEAPGSMEATRTVAQVAEEGGISCPPLSAKLPCNDKPCPTDCVVTAWDKWGECSKACGGGTTKRMRKVTTQPKDDGKGCPVIEERKSCNVGQCGEECKLKPWSPWSACSRRCKFSKNSAAGRQRRVREEDGNALAPGGGSACPAKDDPSRFEARTCNQKICPKGITCDASQDILFILDGSGNAGGSDAAGGGDFKHEMGTVLAIMRDSSKKVGFGIVSYGKEMKVLSRITTDRKQLSTISAYSPPTGGSRDPVQGEFVARSLFSDPGIGGGRPKIAVLFMGGALAGMVNAKKAAEELRSAGVRVVVGLVDDGSQIARDQACSLASKPCSANVEAVKSWEQMAQEPGRFLAGICRDLVYPGPALSKADKMLPGTTKKSKEPKMGESGSNDMSEAMKRQLGIK
jgi:hypothetical protein